MRRKSGLKLRKDRVRISELKGMKSIAVKLRRRNRSETVECTSSGYFEIAEMHAQGSFSGAGVNSLEFRVPRLNTRSHLRGILVLGNHNSPSDLRSASYHSIVALYAALTMNQHSYCFHD
jgi:hypothetical protein